MAKATLAKGSRISGAQRTTLASQYAKRYSGGESIRTIAEDAGRSYGFVHNVLRESGVSLRGRGGATRGTARNAGAGTAKKATSRTPAKKTSKATAAKAGATEPAGQGGTAAEVLDNAKALAKKAAAKTTAKKASTKKASTKKAAAKS